MDFLKLRCNDKCDEKSENLDANAWIDGSGTRMLACTGRTVVEDRRHHRDIKEYHAASFGARDGHSIW